MASTPKTLEERLQRIEDHLAIFQIIAAYGPSADSCNMENINKLWNENCVYDVGGLGYYHGHAGMQEAFDGEFHQEIIKYGSGHASGMPHVVIDGDRATATHHSTLFNHRDGEFKLLRLTASTWQFVRTPGKGLGWQILRRTNRILNGQQEAKDVLFQVMDGPDKKWVTEE